MTGRQISMVWLQGITSGTTAYLMLGSFGITKHPVGFGILFGGLVSYFCFMVVGDE